MSSFAARVLATVRRLPAGRVATYGDVAAMAGRARAWRAVGNIMRECRMPDVPCHRVVAAGGRLGGYGGNVQVKRALLRAEGIPVTRFRIKGFDARRWRAAASEPPATVKRKVGRPPDARAGRATHESHERV
jgi:methylated-DNA-[protein]-cysteine S-methyltransferase